MQEVPLPLQHRLGIDKSLYSLPDKYLASIKPRHRVTREYTFGVYKSQVFNEPAINVRKKR